METIKKKHYATKLKEENAKLLKDLYAILDGDFTTKITYTNLRMFKVESERQKWLGNSSLSKQQQCSRHI